MRGDVARKMLREGRDEAVWGKCRDCGKEINWAGQCAACQVAVFYSCGIKPPEDLLERMRKGL
jgi:hypothetical protein